MCFRQAAAVCRGQVQGGTESLECVGGLQRRVFGRQRAQYFDVIKPDQRLISWWPITVRFVGVVTWQADSDSSQRQRCSCRPCVQVVACNLLNMFRARLCPSSGARDYTASMACGVQLLVVGGRKVRCRAAEYASGMRDAVEQHLSSRTHSIPQSGRIACCPAPDPPTTNNQELQATRHTSSIVASS